MPNPLQSLWTLRDLSFKGLESPSVFASRVALRELEGLLEAAAHVFGPGDVGRLQKLKKRIARDDQERFERFLERLRGTLASTFAGCEAHLPEGEDREAFLRFIVRFRGLKDPGERVAAVDASVARWGRRLVAFCEALLLEPAEGVRARAAFWLGEFAEEQSLEPLIQGLDKCQGRERTERITALGKIGRPEAVPVLKGQFGDPVGFDEVCLALARIGGSEAVDLLERIEARLKDVPGEEKRADRMGYLRSAEFKQDEANRRQKARQRY
jgi:hypothetical protein